MIPHIPASICLIVAAFALLFARALLSPVDVPLRNAFVM